MKVRIYQPDKNPMQSGKAKMKHWTLETIPEKPLFVEPLMGWTGSRETTRQICLKFPSKEAAVAYAQSNKLAYEVIEPKPRHMVKKAYADNFSFNRKKQTLPR